MAYRQLSILCLATLLLASTGSAQARWWWRKPPPCSTVTQLAAKSKSLSTFSAAIRAAGLNTTLNTNNLTATLFVPSNAAFAKFLAGANLTAAQLLNDTQTLTQVLQYHVVPGVAAYSWQLKNKQVLPTLLANKTIQVDLSRAPYGRIDLRTGSLLANDIPAVLLPDNKACKAVVHVIDRVLKPLP